MPAGRLNKRVTFQVETETSDGGGGYTHGWGDDLVVWGGYEPERGRERLEAGRLEDALGGVLVIRSSIATRAISAAHRVLIDGEPHQIRSIANEDQHNRYLTMTVEKGIAV